MDHQSSSVTKDQPFPTAPIPQPVKNLDEINLLEYVYVLVKNKNLIVGLTILGLVIGYIAALIKGPTWVAEAVIAPKERESQRSTSLADLGALGGIVASQLNIDQGSASLNMMDMILDSRDFGARLIEHYSLLPVIYRHQWPKIYEKYWDSSKYCWKSTFVQPKLLDVGNFIKSKYLKKIKDGKQNTLTLKIQSTDSAFTVNLSIKYVEFLNQYIKAKVQTEAKENVFYLDSQLVRTIDPLLQNKIQGLVASEIEKEMVVSREAFKIVDPVYIYKVFKEKRIFPLIACLVLSFLTIAIIISRHVITNAIKTPEDREFLKIIHKELLRVL